MARKSYFRTMLTTRWLRWALAQAACRAFPGLRSAWNFPTHQVRAADIASAVYEDSVERIELDVGDDLHRKIVLPAMAVDAGDTSHYPQKRSWLRTQIARIEHAAINTRTMRIIHVPIYAIVANDTRVVNWNYSKPSVLTRRHGDPDRLYVPILSAHYYHFFTDGVLPMLSAFTRLGDRLGPVVILFRVDAPAYVRATLEAVANHFPFVSLEAVGDDELIDGISALFLSRYADAHEWAPYRRREVHLLERLLRQRYALGPASGARRKLFVSRGSARLRRLQNEDALREALEASGFTVLTPEGANHPDQIRLFSEADVVVAVHGAALTNLVFCPPDARVIEIFASDHIKTSYLSLCHQLGLRYGAVIGSEGDRLQGFSVSVDDVLAEVSHEDHDRRAAEIAV